MVGARSYYVVIPDLASLGKILAGGYPLAAVAGHEEFMRAYDQALDGTDQFVPLVGTLSGNPIAAVLGLATLAELRKPGTYERLASTGQKVWGALDRLLTQTEIPHQIVGENCIFDVFFTDQEVSDHRSALKADSEMMKTWNRTLMENGIFKVSYGYKMYMGLCHTEEDIQQTIAAFEKGVEGLVNC